MPVKRQGIYLGSFTRRRNKEVEKLTFSNNRRGMLKQKHRKMGNAS
jgi:hypothetical protein